MSIVGELVARGVPEHENGERSPFGQHLSARSLAGRRAHRERCSRPASQENYLYRSELPVGAARFRRHRTLSGPTAHRESKASPATELRA